ncbi:MAG: hypothetical protein ACKODX_10810 [Gemmata sp.]
MLRCAPVACCLVLAATGLARAAGPFDDLVKYTPPNTNTVVLIDVKAAYASPLATTEKWREKALTENRSVLGFVPPDAEQVLIAADANLSHMTREYQVGLVKVRNLPNMRDLATREGGSPDEIAGQVAALSPRDVYFTALPGSTLVAVHPADRQYTARYMKAAGAKKTGDLAPYLRKAVDGAGTNTVTIAVDLEDVVDKHIVRLALPASPSVTKVKADVDLLAPFLAQLKGLTFSAKITETVQGSIAVDFALEPARFRKTLPDLFREVLEDQGIAIQGIDNWKVDFAGNRMTLSGPLTVPDLKRIISLFAFPNPAADQDPDEKGNEPTASATKRYLAAVDQILADIAQIKDNSKYEKMATWHDKAADQLRMLNRRNVDPLAVDAAQQCAKRLQAVAQSLRGVPIDQKALADQGYVYYSGRSTSVGWWGLRPQVMSNPGYAETNAPKILAEMNKVVEADKARRTEAWSFIDRKMADTRTALAAKYKTGF